MKHFASNRWTSEMFVDEHRKEVCVNIYNANSGRSKNGRYRQINLDHKTEDAFIRNLQELFLDIEALKGKKKTNAH